MGITARRYDLGTFVMLFGLIENCATQINSLSNVLAKGVYKDTKYLCDYHDFVVPLSNNEMKNVIESQDNDGKLYFGEFKELVLDNVSFSYGDGNEAVKNVSFTLRRGETVSILGYNGSGKTTLSKLICGGLPCMSGKITMNEIEITDENRHHLFAYFGTTPQEFSRFSIPLAEYVGLGRIEKMDNADELERAYRKAGVNQLLYKYEKGDKTVLGKEYDDEGVDLSGCVPCSQIMPFSIITILSARRAIPIRCDIMTAVLSVRLSRKLAMNSASFNGSIEAVGSS